jgi:YHS domain-containing protein
MKTKLHTIAAAILSCITLAACTTTSGVSGAKLYPLKTCIVTDNALDSMGDERSIVHNGQTIKFCCEPCVEKFQSNPAKYLAKLPK